MSTTVWWVLSAWYLAFLKVTVAQPETCAAGSWTPAILASSISAVAGLNTYLSFVAFPKPLVWTHLTFADAATRAFQPSANASAAGVPSQFGRPTLSSLTLKLAHRAPGLKVEPRESLRWLTSADDNTSIHGPLQC